MINHNVPREKHRLIRYLTAQVPQEASYELRKMSLDDLWSMYLRFVCTKEV